MSRKWNITDEQIRQALQDSAGVITKAAELLGVPRKTLSNWVNNLTLESDYAPESKLRIKQRKKGRFVVTCVQNNTELHRPFYDALTNYCNRNNAQLLVIPIRYKNVNAYINEKDYKVSWPEELKDYYLNYSYNVNDNLCIMGDVKIAATAESPLSGMENIAGARSALIGHAQIQLRYVATPSYSLPKQLLTTGSMSLKNYSSSKAGKKANLYHCTGATVVEYDGDLFWARQLNATDDGSFYDLDVLYTPEGCFEGQRADGIMFGDIHLDFIDPDVVKAVWTDRNSLVNRCRPKNGYFQDVLDFYAQNHHHRNNFFLQYAKFKKNQSNVKEELDRLILAHNTIWSREDMNMFYLPSNHHDALTRWLNEADPKYDLENAKIYYELKLKMLQELEETGEIPEPLELYMRNRILFAENTFFPRRGEEVRLGEVDQQHGDKGANGAKGTLLSFAKGGSKSNSGHDHTGGIEKGAYRCGTFSKYNLGYNWGGLSSWIQSLILQYPNGKRTLITIIQGRTGI